MRQCRLAHPRQVLNQKVPFSEQAGHRQPNLHLLAQDDSPDLIDRSLDNVFHTCSPSALVVNFDHLGVV